MKRTLITDQTLEPTQVACFNQFFEDFESTTSWRYGAAVDQKFSQFIFGLVEFSKRDLDVPFLLITPTVAEIQRADANEYLERAYLFWTPHAWLALSADYQYERFKRDEHIAFDIKEVTTQPVLLG